MMIYNKLVFFAFFIIIALASCTNTKSDDYSTVSILGGRSVESIRSVFESLKKQSVLAYEKELTKNYSFGGRLSFRVIVQPNGSISSADLIENTTGSDEFADYMLGLINQLEFEKEDVKQAKIVYKYIYNPG